jgi:molecular chaperone GrpE
MKKHVKFLKVLKNIYINNMSDEIKNNQNNNQDNQIIKEEDKMLNDAHNAEIEDLKKKLEECERQRDEYLAGWQRARADFSNYRKDEALRFEEMARFASENLIKDLIPVLDSFDLGIATLEKSGNVDKGIYMIRAKLEDVLRERGLERVKVEIGKPLNPEIAEAIIEVESEGESGIVLEEIEPGYKLNGKVIRPARVKVSKQKNL